MYTNYVVWKEILKRKKSTKKPVKVLKSSHLSTSPSKDRSTRGQEKCSICSKPAKIQLQDNIDDTSISEAIGSTTNIWVNESVGQSKYICMNCLSDLKTALRFKKKCETSSLHHQFSTNSDSKYADDVSEVGSDPPLKTREFHTEAILQNENLDPDHNISQTVKSPILPISRKYLIKNKKNVQSTVRRFPTADCAEESCPECAEKVKNLKNHIRTAHWKTVKNTCKICGKIVIGVAAFTAHKRGHKNTPYYVCTACPYKTKAKNHLVLHLRTHTGYKPYLCSKCPRQFSHPGNFSKHMHRHAGLTYQCDKCPRKFNLKQGLKFHYESTHLEVTIKHKCSLCEKEFKTRKGLLRHELKIHKRERMRAYVPGYPG